MSEVFTFGYHRVSPPDLLRKLESIDAVLCDIRHRPYSQQPGWSRQDLEDAFGSRYLHLPAFGNMEHREGGLHLADPAGGLAVVVDLLTSSSVVLMCVCRNYSTCHRRAAAAHLLEALGIESSELTL